jgi:prolyl-tRNA synthetase
MRYSQLFGKSIRSVSHDVRSRGHELLIRGGFIRESGAGRFYMLPLGYRVQENVCRIIQEEMNRAGCQQMLAPILHPHELWAETRRTESVSFELMQVKDRSDRQFVLGGTAEEMIVALVRQFSLSERDLPFCIYQFSTKFRDELRARGGLLRAREFLMKDGYSFHTSREDFERFYEQMGKTYLRIFERLGLEAHLVLSGNGYMGGDYAHELIVEHEVGESRYLVSEDGTYAAHEDVATFEREIMNSEEALTDVKIVHAERGASIEDGVKHYGAPAWRQIKSLIYVTDTGEKILVCLRGDLDISEDKLLRAMGCATLRLATEQEISEAGTVAGFISPLKRSIKAIGDLSLTSVRNFITGANEWQRDARNVNYGRDFSVDVLADIALAQDGHRCVGSRSILRERRGVEVGNIFQLGTWYSDRMQGANFTNSQGGRTPYYMGCYGIGIGRTIATIAEIHNDQVGLKWPHSVGPFSTHLIQLGSDAAVCSLAGEMYQSLIAKGEQVLFDDRNVSAGVKFSDADLLGIADRIIVSARLSAAGLVEHQHYRSDTKRELRIGEL